MLTHSEAALHKEPDAEQANRNDFQFIPAAVLLPRAGKEGVGDSEDERPHKVQDHARHLRSVLHREVEE